VNIRSSFAALSAGEAGQQEARPAGSGLGEVATALPGSRGRSIISSAAFSSSGHDGRLTVRTGQRSARKRKHSLHDASGFYPTLRLHSLASFRLLSHCCPSSLDPEKTSHWPHAQLPNLIASIIIVSAGPDTYRLQGDLRALEPFTSDSVQLEMSRPIMSQTCGLFEVQLPSDVRHRWQ
jgi:hypothetical protein